MTLEDFSTIMHNIDFAKNYDGTLNNQFIFDLAKEYNKIIIHKDDSYMFENNKAVDNVLADIYISNIKEFKEHKRLTLFAADGSILTDGVIFID